MFFNINTLLDIWYDINKQNNTQYFISQKGFMDCPFTFCMKIFQKTFLSRILMRFNCSIRAECFDFTARHFTICSYSYHLFNLAVDSCQRAKLLYSGPVQIFTFYIVFDLPCMKRDLFFFHWEWRNMQITWKYCTMKLKWLTPVTESESAFRVFSLEKYE